jgi:hypothetical protein
MISYFPIRAPGPGSRAVSELGDRSGATGGAKPVPGTSAKLVLESHAKPAPGGSACCRYFTIDKPMCSPLASTSAGRGVGGAVTVRRSPLSLTLVLCTSSVASDRV